MGNSSFELRRIAKSISASSLDGERKANAARVVNTALRNLTKGLFKDDGWAPVQKIWAYFSNNAIDYVIIDSKYIWQDKKMTAKVWRFEIQFLNEKGKPSTLYGSITASGAGSVEDPLDKYDLVGYVN